MASDDPTLLQINEEIITCERCPELREYCAHVAATKRKAHADFEYWGKPVPGFGDVRGRIFIVGLAPGAHGANRTGRMFTGDRSGDFLYAALHRVGLANQPSATHREDGLVLNGVYVSNAARCAPPANKPTAAQLANCRPFLVAELRALRPPVVLCLGGIAWSAALAALRELEIDIPTPKPRFGHAGEVPLGFTTLLGSYHVSQQNTFTGRLTEAMFEVILQRARALAGC